LRKLQRPFARVGLVDVELAEMPDQRMADVLGHLHRHAGIVEPHHLRLGRQLQLEQRIDAGADVEDAAQPRLVVDEFLRRRPDHGVVGLRCAGTPVLHHGFGQRGAQAFDPGIGAVVGEADGDSHLSCILGRGRPGLFGEHRGTGFAGPLVLPPARGLAATRSGQAWG
jgi:hypothetical protein